MTVEARPLSEILLVRHGETTWNQEGRYQGQRDAPLSETGRAQARALAIALQGVDLVAAYASPLSRSRETAEIIVRGRGVPVLVHAGLLEINHGAWEGMLAREVAVRYPETVAAWHDRPGSVRMPGGETLAEVRDRAWAALIEIAAAHPGERLLVVGHDAVNKVLLAHILGLGVEGFWRLSQDNGAINRLELHWRGGVPEGRAVLVNDTCHLDPNQRGTGQTAV